jgi:hypothetical protein
MVVLYWFWQLWLLWMLGVTQHWRGCSPHKRKLPTSCPNLVFWLNSILQAMKPIERFECCYLLIYYNLCAICRGGENSSPSLETWSRFSFRWRIQCFNGHIFFSLIQDMGCCFHVILVVEGQVHHIGQIRLSLVDVLLNTL